LRLSGLSSISSPTRPETASFGFKNPLKKDSIAAEQEELIADLYNKIGQLTVELEWLKKKF